MTDRFDGFDARKGMISVGLQEVGKYIFDLETVISETERSLTLASHRDELPEALHLRLKTLGQKLVGMRDEIVTKIKTSGELLKRDGALESNDPLLKDFKDSSDKLIALASRLNTTLQQIEIELAKPLEVSPDENVE